MDKKDIFLCCRLHLDYVLFTQHLHTTDIFLFPCPSCLSSPFRSCEPLALPLHQSFFSCYITDFKDNYRAQNSTNRSILLSQPPSALCQLGETVLIYAGLPLPTDLHETIKDCQHQQTQGERCQHTHTEEPSHSLKNTL